MPQATPDNTMRQTALREAIAPGEATATEALPPLLEAPAAPSRRGLLGRTAGTLLAGAATALAARAAAATPSVTVGDDAELLGCCSRFLAVHRDIEAWNNGDAGAINEEQGSDMLHKWYAALERVTVLPARTPAGIRAKAEVGYLALGITDDGSGERWGREEKAALAALADILGRPVP